MTKKFVITGLSCCFILISGICYSCAYQNKQTPILNSDHSEEKTDERIEVTLQPEESLNISGDSEAESVKESKNITEVKEQTSKNAMIYVHICGAIETPGVYQVESGSRIVDVITLAGGLNQDAASDYINQAQQVMDEQRIYIPTKKELAELSTEDYVKGDMRTSSDTASVVVTDTLVNINTASAGELMNLPGIGQAKANSIIEYRTSEGSFQSIEDLMKIPGIKEGLFNKISSYITIK